jgi:hypothetical protein
MLNISDGTYASLSARDTNAFAQGVIEALREELPEEFAEAGRDDVAAMVGRVIALADQWMIDDEEAIGLLCGMALVFGEDVLTDPTIKEYILFGSDTVGRIHDLLDEIDDAGNL